MGPMISITVLVSLLAASEAVERFVVRVDAAPKAQVDPFSARVVLTGPSDRLAAALKASRVCPALEKTDKGVTLICTTRRLEASVEAVPGGYAIDVRALRGLPWRKAQGGPWLKAWAPETVGLGEPCPGSRPAGKAECFLAAGQRVDAKLALQDALALDPQYGWLRKGDLALEDGELIAGLEAYKRAGDKGPWGRLAKARACELLGSCEAKAFDPVALPEPLQHELLLRAARADALNEHVDAAMRSLLARPAVCAGAETVCADLLRAGLADEALGTRAAALEAWSALQAMVKQPEVTIAAAEAAASLGAKKFAGDLLASVTAEVPAGGLEDHLFRAAGHYADAGDFLRARVMADFAKSRFGDKALTSARWRKVLGGEALAKPAKSGDGAVGIERAVGSDCQRADTVLTAARKAGAAPEPTRDPADRP